MILTPYDSSQADLWDDFVESSRNGTFILKRRFMDYHRDRFDDCSLMLHDDHGRLLALLPACVADGVVSSHAGLTYGGWIVGDRRPDAVMMLEAFNLMKEHYARLGCHTLIYKPIPHIYHRYPAEEDLYALYRHGAVLDAVLMSSVIDLRARLPLSDGVKRHLKKASKANLTVGFSEDFAGYWQILTERLDCRYATRPVHSLDEIVLLKSRFPLNIKLCVIADSSGRLLGGTVLFLSGNVVKAQYIASNSSGRNLNALDLMFDWLIKYYSEQPQFRYFDLGTSNENHGQVLNLGLIQQKCGYGARGIAYMSYKLKL